MVVSETSIYSNDINNIEQVCHEPGGLLVLFFLVTSSSTEVFLDDLDFQNNNFFWILIPHNQENFISPHS